MQKLLWINIHVPFVAAGILLSAKAVFELRISPSLLTAAMCGAWIVYLLDRIAGTSPEDERNHPDRTNWLKAHKRRLLQFCACIFTAFLFSLTALSPRECGGLLVYVPIGLAYVLPILPGRRRIKDLSYAKTPVILLGWSLLPMVLADPADPVWYGYRALYLLPNLLWGDWKDRKGDARFGLRTLGQRFSLLQLKTVSVTSLFLASGLAFASGNHLWMLDAVGAGLFSIRILLGKNPNRTADLADVYALWPLVTGLVFLSR